MDRGPSLIWRIEYVDYLYAERPMNTYAKIISDV